MKTDNSTKSRDCRLEAYRYLKKNPIGHRGELEKEITTDIFREFCNVGILNGNVDGDRCARYMVTAFGKEQIDSILNIEALTEELLVIGRKYCNY